jgi:hypothetical protein
MQKESLWRGKYKTPKEYYYSLWDKEFFTFDNFQLEIDPDEVMDDVEKYSRERQQEEIVKCVESFSYFCHKYIKILHPTKGLIPFIMYKYQSRCIQEYKENRFTIISKFRQGGLTTVTLLYGLWKCMFELDQQVMALSKTDREAVGIGMMVDRAVEHMPEWLKPKKDGKWNDHLKQFVDTGGSVQFYSPEAARGKSVTFLIIDEAAFIPDMENHWKAMWPVLSTGGSCVLVSTVNGLGNWYEETYSAAKDGKNRFHVIDLDYWEHPDYSPRLNPGWEKEQREQLGERGFLQEVLRSFLGSGETYIPSDKLASLDQELKNVFPTKKLFPRFANKDTGPEEDVADNLKGALWIWREPVEGQEYVLGVDCAEGVGSTGDNSCIQVINMNTLEQCAEFYSNLISPHDLTQIVYELGTLYNTALICVEDMAPGGIILETLLHDLYYENLFYLNRSGKGATRPGLKVTVANRPIILQGFQSRINNSSLKMKSRRLLKEMKTFEFNINTKKAAAAKGKHDDAIMAISIALYARDQSIRDVPLGTVATDQHTKTQTSLSDIREELRKGLKETIVNKVKKKEKTALDYEHEFILGAYRKQHQLLKEFGWMINWLSLIGIGGIL